MAVSRANVPVELHERYGLKPRNPIIQIAIWLIALLSFGYLFLQVTSRQNSDVETRLISWQVKSETAVSITWTVYQAENLPVVCTLKAQDSDQFDVGFAIFKATNTTSISKFTQNLKTYSGAYAVLTPTCELNENRLLGPHFRPGLLPPAQEAPLFAPWQWVS